MKTGRGDRPGPLSALTDDSTRFYGEVATHAAAETNQPRSGAQERGRLRHRHVAPRGRYRLDGDARDLELVGVPCSGLVVGTPGEKPHRPRSGGDGQRDVASITLPSSTSGGSRPHTSWSARRSRHHLARRSVRAVLPQKYADPCQSRLLRNTWTLVGSTAALKRTGPTRPLPRSRPPDEGSLQLVPPSQTPSPWE